MKRRAFLRLTSALPAASLLAQLHPCRARAQQRDFEPTPGTWRTYEVTTRVEVLRPTGVARVWIPLPMTAVNYQKALADEWSGNAKVLERRTDSRYGAGMLYAEFDQTEKAPAVTVKSRIQTQDRALDWSKPQPAMLSPAEAQRWTAATDLMPTDGIVGETAQRITRNARTDFEKVRVVYDWILANTYREPKVRGCGVGDIQAMLETQNLGGKCADINALFVGLVRAAGVPARDVYGIRTAPSAFGYKTLGAGTTDITRSQHCRAEVFLADYGWMAMDPADVGKVAREEAGERVALDHPLVAAVRPALFGGWEGNWLAYNMAHDVALPEATQGGRIGFLMYPQAETAQGRRDCLDPDNFKYAISARELG